MFEKLFKYPRVVNRHREGPGADARELFLIHRDNEGAARNTLMRTASELLLIAKYIDVTTDKPVSTHDLEVAAERWVRYQHRRRSIHISKWTRTLFLQIATPWLRFLGLLREPDRGSSPFVHLISDFSDYMRGERGLSEATIRNRCWHVEKFLSGLTRKNCSLGEASVRDVDEFLASKGSKDWGRVSVATSSKALRSFFRHAEIRGWCASGIAASIEGPRVFKQEALPIGPQWAAVQRLVVSANSDRPRDIRDQAILMLFAIYGLRSGEVAGLCIEHLNWEREVIAVVRPKQRQAQQYPLVQSVGDSILRYLQEVRPRSARREIFLTLKAPFRPLSAGVLYHLVSSRLSALEIESPCHGPHSLRHACAGHLVGEGFSLKEVGDQLGHRSSYATRTYAKVDLAGLREVGNFDLGGLL